MVRTGQCGERRNRTADAQIFSLPLYRLSYLPSQRLEMNHKMDRLNSTSLKGLSIRSNYGDTV